MTQTTSTQNIAKRIVESDGPYDADLMIVGEAPGEQELRENKPFVGKSGTLLNNILQRSGLLRSDIYVTNVVKERPHKNNIKPFINLYAKGGPRMSDAYLEYEAHLKQEIERVNPNVVVAVGAVPLWALCRLKGITKWRGSILKSTLVSDQKVIPIIHPAGALRNYIWRHFISFDIRRVKEHINNPDVPDDRRLYYLRPSFSQVMAFLDRCATVPLIAFDIEVSAGAVTCISFAPSKDEVMSVPFVHGHSLYFTPPQEAEVWKKINKILSDPRITKIGQNVMFDASFLWSTMRIHAVNLQDTMIAQAILFPDFPKGLDFITSIYTDIPYYKDEGKSAIKDMLKGIKRSGAGWEERFWLYNAKDSIVLQEAFPKMQDMLLEQGNLQTYESQTRLLEPLLYMTARGIKMDKKGLDEESLNARRRLADLEDEINRLVGRELNPRSPKQLMEYFYIERGLKPYLKNGKPTTDEKALKRLAAKGEKVAILLLEHRSLAKLDGTYFSMKIDDDSRLRSSINPVGTRTGRLSSSKTIFGTGANIQNQPPIMKKYMIPDEGYVAYNVDLSQAENRVVAYLGPDLNMVEAFSTGADIHSTTASLIFGIHRDKIKQMDLEGVKVELGTGEHTHRFWGKKANHALNYGLGVRSLALHLEIPEKESRFIHDRYHQGYPGVRKYHNSVQAQLRKNRTLTNPFGRKYRFVDRWGDSLFKEAYAFIPQSTVADITNRWGLNYIFYHEDEWMQKVELLAQIHDSIVFQIPIEVGWTMHAAIIQNICNNLEQTITINNREVVIPAEASMHIRNLKDGVEIGRPTQISHLNDVLEEGFYSILEDDGS